VTVPSNDDERFRALAEIERDYPSWRAWPGALAGVVYARRPLSSPPWWSGLSARPRYAMRSKPSRPNEG
jgi:hypothetical protein